MDPRPHSLSARPETTRISLLLIEHNRLLRDGIEAMLQQQSDFVVVATDPESRAVQVLATDEPQLVLLGAAPGDGDRMRLLESIRRIAPNARVIVMDLLPAPQDIIAFVEAGCSGFLMKDATAGEFTSIIRAVARGVRVLPPVMAGTIFAHVAQHAGRREPFVIREAVTITPREREVVALIGEGLSNKEIGQRLSIALQTVKSHVHNVLDKLALRTRLQVAAYAHREASLQT